MSEQKPSRSLEQVQSDYQQLCLKAGHTQYQIDALSKDLEMMNQTLRELNFEAAGIQGKQAEESKKIAEVSSEASVEV